MKNKKTIFILSLCFNMVCIAFFMNRAWHLYKPVEKRKPVVQEEVHYFLNRDELFKLLPHEMDEIVFIGDSHIQNFELTEWFHNLKIKNRGINGDYTAGVLKRLDDVLQSKPLKLFIEVGTNDIMTGISTDSILHNYRAILGKIKTTTPFTQTIVISVIPTTVDNREFKRAFSRTLELNVRLAQLCKELKVEYMDLAQYLVAGTTLNRMYYCEDAIHLNPKGYLLWKKLLTKKLI